VIGDVVYADGQPGGCTVIDPETIQLVTSATMEGLHDVVVIDPSGVEGRKNDAFLAEVALRIDSVLPSAGSTAGGDRVTIHGSAFSPQSEVVFGADEDTGAGGTAAPRVTWIDAETLEVVTPAHAAGDASVLVRDPTTGQVFLLDGAFTFASSGGGGGGCAVSTGLPPPGPRMPFEPLAGGAWLLVLAAIVLGRALRVSRAA
jgi:MYXO-CTERM domain-containing protein